jgi:predicted metalloprotease with PDZ domain
MFAQAQTPDTKYTLSYSGGNRLEVELRMTPLEPDSTRFTYGMPAFGGQGDIFSGVSNIHVDRGATVGVDVVNRTIKVLHSGKKPFRMWYTISDTHTPEMAVRGESFRPLISAQYFFSHGINLFLVPVFRDKALNSTVSIQWRHDFPFPLFYGYQPSHHEGPIVAPCSEEFLFSPITGAADMSVDTMQVGNAKAYLVLRNVPGNPLTRDTVGSYFKKFYTAINRFWHDPGDRYFSLILQPFLSARRNISGVAYNTGFVGRYRRDTTFNTEQVFVLSHEIGHHWLGQALSMGENDQWFGEGFNDYVSFDVLLASGQITRQQFVDKMNEAFQKLYASAVRNTPNDSVFANYWKMGDYNRLPYWRGSIFAFWLDNAIRLRSGNAHQLRDALLELLPLRNSADGGMHVTREDFISVVSHYLPEQDIRTAFDRFIMKGETIPFTPEMLLPVFTIGVEGGIPIVSIVDDAQMARMFPAH